MKMIYQYMTIFFNFSLTLNHLHPLQVENCGSNSRLVVDEDYGKFRPERVLKRWIFFYENHGNLKFFFNFVYDFRRQNMTSTDVRFWRLKSIPAL